jgi:hypothetical protein
MLILYVHSITNSRHACLSPRAGWMPLGYTLSRNAPLSGEAQFGAAPAGSYKVANASYASIFDRAHL